MLENLSFYKYPTFGAVIKRFRIKNKIKRKTHFFPREKVFPYLTQPLMGKWFFF
jgi:hypothetical protein